MRTTVGFGYVPARSPPALPVEPPGFALALAESWNSTCPLLHCRGVPASPMRMTEHSESRRRPAKADIARPMLTLVPHCRGRFRVYLLAQTPGARHGYDPR